MACFLKCLSGGPEPVKNGNVALLYGIVALVSLLLTLWYLFFNRQKERKLMFLYVCVATANLGYFLLAVSDTVAGAMMANRLSYLGNAFLVILMLMIIVEVCGFRMPKWVAALLIFVSTLAFLLAACGDWRGLYYAEVTLETVNGATRLSKVYGISAFQQRNGIRSVKNVGIPGIFFQKVFLEAFSS